MYYWWLLQNVIVTGHWCVTDGHYRMSLLPLFLHFVHIDVQHIWLQFQLSTGELHTLPRSMYKESEYARTLPNALDWFWCDCTKHQEWTVCLWDLNPELPVTHWKCRAGSCYHLHQDTLLFIPDPDTRHIKAYCLDVFNLLRVITKLHSKT